jgi:preprotein translocase subunit YajC
MSFIPAAILALQAAPGGPSPYGSLFMFTMIILIFWLIIFRPQQRQRKQHEDALRALKRGDRIVTAGGIVAEVIHIKEGAKDGKPAPAMDDEITIKSGETRLIVERGRISKIVTDSGTSTAAPTTK